MTKDSKPKSQLLQCKSGLSGFADCPNPLTRHALSEKCLNSKRCSITPKHVRQRFCTQSCDYAVLVSGGWNGLTATSRTEESVRSMWWYLRQNGFRPNNIMVFIGSQYSVESKCTVLLLLLFFLLSPEWPTHFHLNTLSGLARPTADNWR